MSASSLVFSTLLPIVWLAYALITRKVKVPLACFIALVLASLSGLIVWRMPVSIFLWSVLDGLVFAVWPILWAIFAALFTYRVTCETGAIEGIKGSLMGVSGDRAIQVIIIAFCFGALLEGVAGFGTSVVIPAALLVSMGFAPYRAALMALLANTVPVVYAAVGIPIVALGRVTGLPVLSLTRYIALQLLPATIVVPVLMVLGLNGMESGRLNRAGLGMTISAATGAGIVFGLTQLLVAWYVGPELPAILAPIVTLGCLIIWVGLAQRKKKDVPRGKSAASGQSQPGYPAPICSAGRAQLVCWAPYALLVFLILLTRLMPSLHDILMGKPFFWAFPARPLGKTISIDILYTPGSLMFLSALLGGTLLGARFSHFKKALAGAALQILPTVIITISMVVLANIMSGAGMTDFLARGLARAVGKWFPLVSPAIGALGTFLAGSDTASNVLFGKLQVSTAGSIGVSSLWLAAANAAGATGGKLLSLQNLTLAASGIGKPGEEVTLLRFTAIYCMIYLILLGVIIQLGAGF